MTTSYRPIAGDPWILARPKLRKHGEDDKGFYGSYPAGFLWRARSLLGIHFNDPLLHICGGRVKDYAGDSDGLGPNDRTIDIDPKTSPDFLMDVRDIGLRPGKKFPLRVPTEDFQGNPTTGFVVANVEKKTRAADSPLLVDGRDFDPLMLWPAALIDRPYTLADAEHYMDGKGHEVFPENLGELLASVMSIVRPGGCIGVLDYLVPGPPKDAKFVSMTPVWCGFNNRIRAYSVFRSPLVRTGKNKVNVTVELRGSDEPPVEGENGEADPLDVAGPFCSECAEPAVTVLHGSHRCEKHRPPCSHCDHSAKVEGPNGTVLCASCASAPVAPPPAPVASSAGTDALRSAAFDL
jgi:hypothetical protein